MTLFVFSFLYRDNPLYKLAESTVVGVSAAYWMVIGFWTTLVPNLFGVLAPGWIQSWAQPGLSPLHVNFWQLQFIPLVLSGMLLWRLMPVGGWISRWPLAFIIGATAGIRLIGYLQADFISQINNSILPLIVMDNEGRFRPWDSLRHLLIVGSIPLLPGLLLLLVRAQRRRRESLPRGDLGADDHLWRGPSATP